MLNNYIDKSVLYMLVENKVPFKKCLTILNVSSRTLKKFRKVYGLSLDKELKNFISECKRCGNKVEYRSTREKDVYCSRSCSNKRDHSDETKRKISESIKSKNIPAERLCVFCGVDISMKRKKNTYCSRRCAATYYSSTDVGKEHIKKIVSKSMKSQSRRSKNEVLFFERCNEKFNFVENNIIMFNGWDADIIIHDHKLAILWNGIWHYKKIYKNQSLEQIQNRDKIKVNEIIKFGYEPYIIKDMGKFSENKVNEEFDILINYISKIKNKVL